MEKIVIVGGVAAGATAAAKVRRLSPNAKIIMLEAGADISFANCGLPYYIGGDIKNRSSLILQSPESFKEQYDVEVHTHTTVTSINKEAHTIETQNSQNGQTATFSYTKLILAQGGRPIKPELPGAEQEHVFTLWTLADMDKITSHIENKAPKKAVVVGGGFIGLEMVEALVKRGLEVSVVEKMPHVMALMEAETAGFIERELQSYDVNIHTGKGLEKINSNSVVLDDGTNIEADMVLLSIGVRPTLQLAKDSGLEIGEAGGLLVNEYLQTSNPDIYGAGDMVEINHRVNGKKIRIPLAGPANRQGRIAAENALGGQHVYQGAIGTSVVRVFEAVAGITGLSLKHALSLGINADAIVVHKEAFTSYYPGSEPVSVMLVYDKDSGVILGGQTAGYIGADKRLDVIATAAATKRTISELADLDLAYSPPIGTANDAINMAAYVAENKRTGYSPSITASQLDDYVAEHQAIVIDVRDIFAFEKSHIEGAAHVPLELLAPNVSRIPKNKAIIVYDETGKKGHQALRTLMNAGLTNVVNISGGHTSLQRYAITVGFKNIHINVLPIEAKSIEEEANTKQLQEEEQIQQDNDQNSTLIIDVRSQGEFMSGAFPDAINIPLDEIMAGTDKIGDNLDREIIVYCASGARSAYAQQILMQRGYTNVENGGGLAMMMSRV